MDDWTQLAQRTLLLVFLLSSMAAAGMSLSPRQILGPLRDVRLVGSALLLNFVLAPALAWLLARWFALGPGETAGLIMLGCAAGAPFLPKLVEFAGGDLASAVALMVLLTGVTIAFLPLALPLLLPGLEAAPWDLARPLVRLVLLPLAAGMLARCLAPERTLRLAPRMARLASLSMVTLFGLLVVRGWRDLLDSAGDGVLGATSLHLFGLGVAGWLLGGPRPDQRPVLGFGTAVRNFPAALVPLTAGCGDPQALSVLLVSAITGSLICLPAAVWWRRATSNRFP